MEEIEITIVNWNKHQEYDEERKNPAGKNWNHKWFKLSNRLYESYTLKSLDPAEKWAFLSVLCLCSQARSQTITVKPDEFEWKTRTPKETLLSCLNKLERDGTVTVLRQHCDETVAPDKIRVDKIRVDKKRKEVCVELNGAAVSSPPTHSVENLVLNLSEQTREKIQGIYPDEVFVRREVEKMKVWLGNNPRKLPKSRSGWSRFVMGWLERGWERYRTTIPSNRGATTFDWNNIFGDTQ